MVVRRSSGYLFFLGRSSRNDWPTNAQAWRGLALKHSETDLIEFPRPGMGGHRVQQYSRKVVAARLRGG